MSTYKKLTKFSEIKQWENTFKEASYKLQEKKKYWKSLVKDTNTLYDFLKDNYYENSTTK